MVTWYSWFMKKLVVYQVWNKEDHKVVFLDHKPTVVELFTISLNHHWIGLFDSEESQHYFIKSLDVKKNKYPRK